MGRKQFSFPEIDPRPNTENISDRDFDKKKFGGLWFDIFEKCCCETMNPIHFNLFAG